VLKNTSIPTIDNVNSDDIVCLFITNIGEVICSISDSDETSVTVKSPYRFILQENSIGLAPIGSLAAIIEQSESKPPSVSISRSSIVYVVAVPSDIADSYKEKVSDITIARGDVNSIVKGQ